MTNILLVEDTPELAELIKRELSAAGYTVLHAPDGTSALQKFQNETPPAIIILDWMLPGLDGLEVLRRLRRFSAIPVLMLTARSDEADRVIGLELGADDYLTKPFSMRELIARVRALLRRAELLQEMLSADKTTAGQIIQRGSLYLDPQSFIATLDSKPLDLTRTEFMLLHLLLRNPGRTFSRQYLLDTIWGENYLGGDRSVDNAILRLRKKLGTPGEAIETVWGVGYRMQS